MQSYVWQDIAGVQTGCHHYMGFRGRGRDNIAYNLVMRDGAVINIMDNPRYTEAVWPAILAQLDNVPFWFNHAAVEPRCAFPREDLLLTRP